jgi:hypothetical protein
MICPSRGLAFSFFRLCAILTSWIRQNRVFRFKRRTNSDQWCRSWRRPLRLNANEKIALIFFVVVAILDCRAAPSTSETAQPGSPTPATAAPVDQLIPWLLN